MTVVALKHQTERKPGPYSRKRSCESCGAFLSSYNAASTCAPCSGGDWIPGDPSEAEVRELRAERLQEIGAQAA